MLRVILLLWCCCLGVAHAQMVSSRTDIVLRSGGGNIMQGAGQGTVLLSDLLSRTRNVAPAGNPWSGGVILKDLLDKPFRPRLDLPGGTIPLGVERAATARGIATAAARLLPVVGTALAVKELVELAGCKWTVEHIITCQEDEVEVATSDDRWCYGSYCALSHQQVAAYLRRALQAERDAQPYERAIVAQGVNVGEFGDPVYQQFYKFPYVDRLSYWPTEPHWRPIPDSESGTFTIQRQTGAGTRWECPFELVNGECVLVQSPEEFGERVEARKDQTGVGPKLVDVTEWMDHYSHDYPTEVVRYSGPAAAPGGRVSTTTNPDGSITVRDVDYRITYLPTLGPNPYVTVTPRETVTTSPPDTEPAPYTPLDPVTGEPDPSAPAPPGGSTTTIIEGSSSTTMQVETCGLPTTPPCKIDESGTPPPPNDNPGADAEGLFAAIKGCVLSPSTCVPALPSLDWSFELPSSCSVIPTPAYSPWITEIDLCPYQEVFHQVMGLIWAGAGLFIAVSMVFRDATGS